MENKIVIKLETFSKSIVVTHYNSKKSQILKVYIE